MINRLVGLLLSTLRNINHVNALRVFNDIFCALLFQLSSSRFKWKNNICAIRKEI